MWDVAMIGQGIETGARTTFVTGSGSFPSVLARGGDTLSDGIEADLSLAVLLGIEVGVGISRGVGVSFEELLHGCCIHPGESSGQWDQQDSESNGREQHLVGLVLSCVDRCLCLWDTGTLGHWEA